MKFKHLAELEVGDTIYLVDYKKGIVPIKLEQEHFGTGFKHYDFRIDGRDTFIHTPIYKYKNLYLFIDKKITLNLEELNFPYIKNQLIKSGNSFLKSGIFSSDITIEFFKETPIFVSEEKAIEYFKETYGEDSLKYLEEKSKETKELLDLIEKLKAKQTEITTQLNEALEKLEK